MISDVSFSLKYGIDNLVSGKLTPLLLDTSPLFITLHTISVPSTTFSTINSINPSSSKILEPSLTSFGKFLYVIETISFVPEISLLVSVNWSPFFNDTFPSSN